MAEYTRPHPSAAAPPAAPSPYGDAMTVVRIAKMIDHSLLRPTVKVILENAYLTDEQKVAGCRAAERAGAHFVKNSTGFAPGGATMDDLALMRSAVSPAVQIKAAGGVR